MKLPLTAVRGNKRFEKVGNVSVPIYETVNKGYSAFTVCWYEGGKRSRKVFANLKNARSYATQIATKIENQERQVLTLRAEDSRMFVACATKLQPFGVTLEEAVREYIAAREIIGDHPLSDAVRFWKAHHGHAVADKSIASVVAEFIATQKRDGVSGSYSAELERFLGHVTDRFAMNIADISTAMLDEYLRSMDCGAVSRNTYRRKLVALFNFARRMGYVSDKATAADRTAKAREVAREIEIFRPQEMALLLGHATDGLVPFLVLCGFCGLRPVEARRLHWEEINFAEGHIEVKASKAKTASRRLAVIPPNAAKWLLRYSTPTGIVVKLARVVHALQRLNQRVNAALAKEGHGPLRMPRNALRHSFVSYRLAATQNPNQTALEAGHDVRILFRHYRELVSKSDAEKWFAIEPDAATNVISIAA
jgi:integrase